MHRLSDFDRFSTHTNVVSNPSVEIQTEEPSNTTKTQETFIQSPTSNRIRVEYSANNDFDVNNKSLLPSKLGATMEPPKADKYANRLLANIKETLDAEYPDLRTKLEQVQLKRSEHTPSLFEIRRNHQQQLVKQYELDHQKWWAQRQPIYDKIAEMSRLGERRSTICRGGRKGTSYLTHSNINTSYFGYEQEEERLNVNSHFDQWWNNITIHPSAIQQRLAI